MVESIPYPHSIHRCGVTQADEEKLVGEDDVLLSLKRNFRSIYMKIYDKESSCRETIVLSSNQGLTRTSKKKTNA